MAEDGWKSCLDWMKRCQVFENGQLPTSDEDFAHALRDGVIICNLLNHLSSGSLEEKDFSQRPQLSEHLCSKNIRAFIQTCVQVFKLDPAVLFSVEDLFVLEDFNRVLNTLSLLSQSGLAQKSGIKGFKNCNQDYKRLKSLAEKSIEGSSGGGYSKYEQDEEKIYQDICSMQNSTLNREESGKVSKITKREYVIKELVETEKNYLAVLQMIITFFVRALQSILEKEDSRIIFGNIEELHSIHVGFNSDLSKACHSRHGSIRLAGHLTISDCFIKWKEKFLMYGQFCSNLPNVQSTLNRLMQSNRYKEAILECQKKANGGRFRLRDLLSVPMQRILKYPLILKELLKNTDPNHPEKKVLDKALDEMQDLACYVNETKRDNETIQWIKDIQISITNIDGNTDLRSYGRLHKDGELKYKKPSEKKERVCFLFLFDKMLLVCKIKGNETYSLRDYFELFDIKFEELPTPREKDKFLFVLYTEEVGKPLATFYAKNQETRIKWFEAFQIARDNVNPVDSKNGRHSFLMTSFYEPTICDVCRKYLRGIFYQGYKCQNTNMVVHKDCISKAKNIEGPPTLPPKQFTGQRVRAKTSYDGQPSPPDQLQPLRFAENDIFLLLRRDNDPWWFGRNAGREGYFHKSLVLLLRNSAILDNTNQREIRNSTLIPSFLITPTPSCSALDPFKHPGFGPLLDTGRQKDSSVDEDDLDPQTTPIINNNNDNIDDDDEGGDDDDNISCGRNKRRGGDTKNRNRRKGATSSGNFSATTVAGLQGMGQLEAPIGGLFSTLTRTNNNNKNNNNINNNINNLNINSPIIDNNNIKNNINLNKSLDDIRKLLLLPHHHNSRWHQQTTNPSTTTANNNNNNNNGIINNNNNNNKFSNVSLNTANKKASTSSLTEASMSSGTAFLFPPRSSSNNNNNDGLSLDDEAPPRLPKRLSREVQLSGSNNNGPFVLMVRGASFGGANFGGASGVVATKGQKKGVGGKDGNNNNNNNNLLDTIPPSTIISTQFADTLGEDLTVYPWFVGEMMRDRSEDLLMNLEDGTYLVRISKAADRRGELSLSIRFGTSCPLVKHIKIQKNANKRWFLADSRTFPAVQELINFYQSNCLSQCFIELPTKLILAFKDTLPDTR